MRRALVLLLALASAAGIGCSARPRGTAIARQSVARDGWARLGPGVHLRDDTPSLSTVLAPPEEPAASAPIEYGPRGTEGESSPWTDASGSSWPSSPYPLGYPTPYPPGSVGWPGYVAPGGAVPPALRPPSDTISPYAGPYLTTFPASDVASHRPGLSSGAAVYGRHEGLTAGR